MLGGGELRGGVMDPRSLSAEELLPGDEFIGILDGGGMSDRSRDNC